MRWMSILAFLGLAALGACGTQNEQGPPLSSTTQIITPQGHKVNCTISTGALCVQ